MEDIVGAEDLLGPNKWKRIPPSSLIEPFSTVFEKEGSVYSVFHTYDVIRSSPTGDTYVEIIPKALPTQDGSLLWAKHVNVLDGTMSTLFYLSHGEWYSESGDMHETHSPEGFTTWTEVVILDKDTRENINILNWQ